MAFWDLAHADVALVEDGAAGRRALYYDELAVAADTIGRALPSSGDGKSLGFLLFRSTLDCVAAYLAALRSGHALALLTPHQAPGALEALVARYRPEWIAGGEVPPLEGYQGPMSVAAPQIVVRHDASPAAAIHPDTALLLSTSGSTGSPKMVRLSYRALDANAKAIAEYLGLNTRERAITTMPLSYSYGLSVLNSHLHAGARTLLTEAPILGRPFWDFFAAEKASSLAGVPYIYQMLQRLRPARMDLPSLRMLTQAGGHLAEPIKREFAQLAAERGWRFFAMYGQTEASARIAYVPSEKALEKLGAIGITIPGGTLSIDPGNGELCYRGDNVMMGYAESREDLAQGDTLAGMLRTGDLARQDEDGYFYITGRLKRIAKVFGNRVSLDEVEQLLEARLGLDAAALDAGDRLLIVSERDAHEDIVALLRAQLDLHPSGFQTRCVPSLPRLPSGKKDYAGLLAKLAVKT
ncbi:AMP-binding protein [Niveibacterium sp. SC-1]|uniref:AMP-binding protein n=1 Tax=Niveibacterium sp. SC-1 TaxID=3135646 RepID=UPI00311DCE7B